MTQGDIGDIFILGHRGTKGPLENTIPAFRRALNHSHGIEFDVRITMDGKLVPLHEGVFTVDGRQYRVELLTYGELVKLHPLGKLIPTLDRVLKLRPGVVNADLKDINALESLLSSLERRKILGRTVISTDVPDWINIVRKECPDCKVGLSVTSARNLFQSLGFEGYSIHVPLDLIGYIGFRGFLTLLTLYRRKKKKVWLWNYRMNELSLVPKFMLLVDAVISDDPARLKKFIAPRRTEVEATLYVGEG